MMLILIEFVIIDTYITNFNMPVVIIPVLFLCHPIFVSMTQKLKNINAGIEEVEMIIARAKETGRNTLSLERIRSELITIRLQILEEVKEKEGVRDILIELS